MVKGTSEIISQARNVVLRGEKAADFFPSGNLSGTDGGIVLSTDGQIRVQATLPCDTLKEQLTAEEKSLTTQVNDLKKEAAQTKAEVSSLISSMNDLVAKDTMNLDETSTRTNFVDIEELHEEFRHVSAALYHAMTAYFGTLSRLAESNRQLESVKTQKEAASKRKSTYKEKTTGTSISLRSENIDLVSMDGDGNLRTNADSGIGISGKQVTISSYGDDHALIKESGITLASQQVEINTGNPKVSGKNSEVPAEGSVRVVSKDIRFEAVDYQTKEKKIEEKSLTKDGVFSVRTVERCVSATDTEGKATGSFAANAKQVEVKSMDVDKEKRTDKSLHREAPCCCWPSRSLPGRRTRRRKANRSNSLRTRWVCSAIRPSSLQQDGKAILQLSGGNASLSVARRPFTERTTSEGKTTFKSDVTAGTVTMKNLKVDSSFKTPYTTEGISVPGAPSTAKLSAKLKEEEMKTTK